MHVPHTRSLFRPVVWSSVSGLRCRHRIQQHPNCFKRIFFWAKSVHLLNDVQMSPTKTAFSSLYTPYPKHWTSTPNRMEQLLWCFQSPAVFLHLRWDLLWCASTSARYFWELKPVHFGTLVEKVMEVSAAASPPHQSAAFLSLFFAGSRRRKPRRPEDGNQRLAGGQISGKRCRPAARGFN